MYDADLLMKDAGLVAADAAGTVDGSPMVFSVGPGRVEGFLVVDVSAIEIADNDELYKIKLQGSSRKDFAHNVEDLAILELGAKEVLGGDQDSAARRYAIPFTNERDGYLWPHLRVYTDVNGTIASGINFTAWLTNAVTTRTTGSCTATTTTTTTTTTTV
ncbi:MAG: hypothetical protein KMY53_17900 [Desulfarculus sp.]|nr:hypothetical protein [Pseudomonadota bacterium]MBU4577144.1 hypothetical protein [Pseudomonadota bacterium]MBU4598767.1 hypothetical protein [Pseudomonadota bacterium]MBV1717471.1 hypothetical protein [Desulfarculus sp.]MBV1740041.1 hypothetical protein [Desulfarculus sp.]